LIFCKLCVTAVVYTENVMLKSTVSRLPLWPATKFARY